jgi:hypothetical protein
VTDPAPSQPAPPSSYTPRDPTPEELAALLDVLADLLPPEPEAP